MCTAKDLIFLIRCISLESSHPQRTRSLAMGNMKDLEQITDAKKR